MADVTLAEKIRKDFSKVKIIKSRIKVPRLKITSKKQRAKAQKPSSQIPISTLINIFIRNSIETARKEAKEKSPAQTGKVYSIIKDNKDENIGGYGTVSKNYGGIQTSYVDYEKIFSHVGKFRAHGMYQSFANSDGQNNAEKGFSMASVETMDKAAAHIKYFRHGGREFGVGAGGYDTMSMVPMGGMDIAEWQEFKMWFLLDKVAYYLKRKTA
ncbi:MAG TPA: hypothetical protein VJI52_02435 [Candidatus Nanoarchaeia archaeon]|nr:hypothetical protein [Candidatus Nanoarchaeia archaeon]